MPIYFPSRHLPFDCSSPPSRRFAYRIDPQVEEKEEEDSRLLLLLFLVLGNLFVPYFWLIEDDVNRLNSTFNLPGRREEDRCPLDTDYRIGSRLLAGAERFDPMTPLCHWWTIRWRGIRGGGVLFEMIGVNATVDGNKNFMGVVLEIGVYCTPRSENICEKEERDNIFGNRDLRKLFFSKIRFEERTNLEEFLFKYISR